LAGFQAWVGTAMGISPTVLPLDSPFYGYAFNVAMEIVPYGLGLVGGNIYQLTVYNLGGDNLVNFTQDTPPSVFFENLRNSMNINNPALGVVSSSGDQGTNTSYLNPDFMKGFTLANLQNLKTPWGRTALGFMQRTGSIWGLS